MKVGGDFYYRSFERLDSRQCRSLEILIFKVDRSQYIERLFPVINDSGFIIILQSELFC